MAKKKLIEKMEFDNYAYAKDVYEKSAAKLLRIKIGLIIAAVATVCSVLAMVFHNISDSRILTPLFVLIAFFVSLVAYIVGGGILIALKTAKKLTDFGGSIFPFPIGLITGFATLFFSVLAFFFVPLVFVFINFIQQKKNRDNAAEYLSYFKSSTEESE